LVDLVANYHSQDFLLVPEDFAKETRQAGLIPFQSFEHLDPELHLLGGPILAGQFCPKLSWMATALNNKMVSTQRMGTDVNAGNRAFESAQKMTWVGVAVTAIHDVDVDEFASALDAILISTGGTGNCSVTATWIPSTNEDAAVLKLRGADLDTDVHKIRVGSTKSHKRVEFLLSRTVDFGEREWILGLDRGEFAVSFGHSPDLPAGNGTVVETQTLLHLERASTALHIYVWVTHSSLGEGADIFALEELITDFSVELVELTVGKLLGWSVAHQLIGE
jgi:hypothetical protein